MIRRTLSVVLEVIAGVFFYVVCAMAFINEPGMLVKWGILIGFSIPATIALVGGLALIKFSHWKWHVGIVLFSVACFTAFLVFSFICMFSSEEVRSLMKPDSLSLFSDYLTGGAVIIGFAVLGWGLKNADRKETERDASPASASNASL